MLKDQFVQPVGLNRIRTIRVETPRNVRSGPGKQYPDQGKQYEAEINTGDMIEIWMELTEKDADGSEVALYPRHRWQIRRQNGLDLCHRLPPRPACNGRNPKIDPVPVPENTQARSPFPCIDADPAGAAHVQSHYSGRDTHDADRRGSPHLSRPVPKSLKS